MRIQRRTAPLVVILTALLGVLAHYNKLSESNTASKDSKSSGIQINPTIHMNPNIRGGDQNSEVSPNLKLHNSNEAGSSATQSNFDDSLAPKDDSQLNQEKVQRSSSSSTSSISRSKPQLVAQASVPPNNTQPPEGWSQSVGPNSNGNNIFGPGSNGNNVFGPGSNGNIANPRVNRTQNITGVEQYIEDGGKGANTYCAGHNNVGCGAGGSTFNVTPTQQK